MCVVSVIVKRPVLPPSVADGLSRNPLYYYYYFPLSPSLINLIVSVEVKHHVYLLTIYPGGPSLLSHL